MSVERNKLVVRTILEAIGRRDMAAVLPHVHDEGSWSIPYRQDRFSFGGRKDKKAFGEMVGGFLGTLAEISMEIRSMAAEGDFVAVLAESEGTAPNGARYRNIYHFSFEMRDGRAYRVLEFLDPFEVAAFVEQLPQ